MKNEEQLREEWRKQTEGKYSDDETRRGAKLVADWWLAKLHQAELNWITAQIERGELAKYKQEYENSTFWRVGEKSTTEFTAKFHNAVIDDLNAPLIERKKELEAIIG